MPGAAANVLYVSYDGVLEPLGESQVVAYVERLAARYVITIMSFEKAADLHDEARARAMRDRLAARGIRWICLRYHQRPQVASTAFDIVNGIWQGHRGVRGAVALIHARGYVAALIALAIARLTRAAFVFDMRGFWADEKVDGGHWAPGSWIYGVTKRFERRFFESADAIVSLTAEGVAAFPSLGYRIPTATAVEVIPTCTDLDRFAPGPGDDELRARLGLTGHLVIGVSGTMTNWYLREPMLRALAHLVKRLDSAKVLVVTRDDADRLRHDAAAAGVPADKLVVTSAPYESMPDYMRLMNVGLFFIKVCFSKKGSCATKLAEFLASGVPVVINDGIGDSGGIVRKARVGVVLPEASVDALERHMPELASLLSDAETSRRCRATARTHFDVVEGSRRYELLYDRLLHRAAPARPGAEAPAL